MEQQAWAFPLRVGEPHPFAIVTCAGDLIVQHRRPEFRELDGIGAVERDLHPLRHDLKSLLDQDGVAALASLDGPKIATEVVSSRPLFESRLRDNRGLHGRLTR